MTTTKKATKKDSKFDYQTIKTFEDACKKLEIDPTKLPEGILDYFKKKDFRDFKTFDDLCRAIGTTEEDFDEKWDPRVFDPSTIAFERLKVCTRAYNPDWKFNAYDTSQYKYYPYFEVLSSGFGFSTSNCSYARARTAVGSRLCFESQEKAIHAGKTFIKLFEDFITAKY